jgi:hypothetical protein
MAVHQNNQHQGIGLALMQNLLAWLEKKQVSVVKLDASPVGQPLYERLGFIDIGSVVVFQREIPPPALSIPLNVRQLSFPDLKNISDLDGRAFGTDRGQLLHQLLVDSPRRAFLAADKIGKINGYLFAQQNRIGPWVMQNADEAEALLHAALSLQFPGPITIVVPGENMAAVTLLKKHGFIPKRINRHMVKGFILPAGQRKLIFSQTSLSLG